MYLKQLTFTRFLAATWVVFFHSGNLFSNPSLIGLISKGSLGVSYFFVLSGFVMIVAYYNPKKPFSNKSYYINRLLRIYPLYLFATIISIFLKYLIDGKVFTLSDIFINILVVQAYFFPFSTTVSQVFGLGWSLTTEFLFYAIFPFLLKKLYFFKNLTFKEVSLIIFLTWLTSIILSSYLQNINYTHNVQFHDFIFHFPIWHVNQFLIGNLFGLLYVRNNTSTIFMGKYGSFVVIFLVFILLVFLKILPFWSNKYSFFPYALNVHNGILAYLFGSIILVLSYDKGLIKKLFSLSLMVILGEISYAIYLLQEIALYLWHIIIDKSMINLNPKLFFLTYFLFLILLSYIAHIAIEKPFLKYFKRKIK